MKKLMLMLMMLNLTFPVVVTGADYLYLDKRGKVKGWAIDDGDTVRFFDRSLKPSGFYDRDTNTTFDSNFKPTGTIYPAG
jgi:hypothetical protein